MVEIQVIRDDHTVERYSANKYYYHESMVDIVSSVWNAETRKYEYTTVTSLNVNTVREVYTIEHEEAKVA